MTDAMLPYIWFFIVCLELALYVILDGADLGIGALSLLPQKEGKRSLMMHVVGPIWDANETWLVIAGGTLFGAFPLAYSLILSSLYIPIMTMVFGLILRAASFEFHEYTRHKRLWSFIFGFASVLAIVGQGLTAGGLLSGLAITNGHFSGGPFDWATPITFFVTVGVLMSYVVVGYAYLIKKMDYELRHESFSRVMLTAAGAVIAFIASVAFLPREDYIFFARWTVEPSHTILTVIAVAIFSTSAFIIYSGITKRYSQLIHPLSVFLFVLALGGLLVGIFPYIIPPSVTIAEAASSAKTLRFMLWGVAPLIPIVMTYNFFLYRVFKSGRNEHRGEGY